MPAPKSHRRKSPHPRKSARARRTARRPRFGRARGAVAYLVERENVLGTNSRVSGDIVKKFVNGTLVAQKFASAAEIKRAVSKVLARKKGGFWPFSSKPADPSVQATVQEDTSMWASLKKGLAWGAGFFVAEAVVGEVAEEVFGGGN